MLIAGAKGNKIIDCNDVFIKSRTDFTDRNKTFCYDVKGVLNSGRTEVIATFETEEEAKNFIYTLVRDFGANTRALEANNDELGRAENTI